MRTLTALAALALAATVLTGCGSQDSHQCDAAGPAQAPAAAALANYPLKGGSSGGSSGGGRSSGGSSGSKGSTSSGSKAGTSSGSKAGTTTGSKPGGVGTSARPGYRYVPGPSRPVPPPTYRAPLRPVTVNHYYGGYAYGYYMPNPYGYYWPYWVMGASTHEEQDPCTA